MATFTDDFNRADALTLGSNWQVSGANSWEISGNQAKPSTSFTAAARWNADCATNQQYSELVYAAGPTTSIFVGPAVLMPTLGSGLTTTGDYYTLNVSGTSRNTLSIRKKTVNSSGTTVMGATVTFTVNYGDVLRLATDGVDLIGYVNGVERIRRAISLLPLTAGGLGVGWHAGSSAGLELRFDNWAGGDLSAAPAPKAGAGSGTSTFSGSGVGSRPSRGAGSGSATFAGTGVGSRPSRGAGSGSATFTGSGVGAKPGVATKRGAGSGSATFTGSGVGRSSRRGKGTGTSTFSGSGVGLAKPIVKIISTGRGGASLLDDGVREALLVDAIGDARLVNANVSFADIVSVPVEARLTT